MRTFEHLEQKEAESLIAELLSSSSEDLAELKIEIINFSFTPIISILQKIQFRAIELNVHCYRDLETPYFNQKLIEFADALRGQSSLKSFSFTHAYYQQNSVENNNAVVTYLCRGLIREQMHWYDQITFCRLVSDTGAAAIADFFKENPNAQIRLLTLVSNEISDTGAATLIEATHYLLGIQINLMLNQLTDKVVNTVLCAPFGHDIITRKNQLSLSAESCLKTHKMHMEFLKKIKFTRLSNSLLYPPQTPHTPAKSRCQNIEKFLSSTPDCSYIGEQKTKTDFYLSPTAELSINQLLKSDPRIWKKSCADGSSPKLYKEIVICAWGAIFFNSFFRNHHPSILKILFWQGDPAHLATTYDEKFTPAIAEEVQDLLERAHPGRQFWVIDENIWQQQLFALIQNQKASTYWEYLLWEYDLNHPHKEVDLSPYKFWITNDLFKRILPGLAKTTTQLDLSGCIRLSQQTIVETLSRFRQLKFLGLRGTPPWGEELATLIQACPFLEELEICIDTLAPLKILAQMRELQHLYLDLSNNLQLQNLDFLKERSLGNSVTLLKLANCSNLIDLTGLRYCPNLTELWLEGIKIQDFDGLIVQLGQLKKIEYWVFHNCQYTLSDEKQASNLIKKHLPQVYISIDKDNNLNVENPFIEGIALSSTVLNTQQKKDRSYHQKLQELELKTISAKNPQDKELTCAQSPADRSQRKTSASQVFCDNKGHWPDHRLDRNFVLTTIQIKSDGHIVFTAPPIAQRELKICPGVEVVPFDAIQTRLLRPSEAKSQKNYYAGQLTLLVTTDNWTPVPTRGVFSRPMASSEQLIWARSSITGELFVQLPKSAPSSQQPQSKKILLRYMIVAVDTTHQRQTQVTQSLPPVIRSVFGLLCQDKTILENFPAFRRLITDLSWIQGSDQALYARIIQYCQMEPWLGFSDQPLDDKASQIVRAFVDSLTLENPRFSADLMALFDALLQQRGACLEICRCVKLLCDYFGVFCHIGLSATHGFLEHSYYNLGKLITKTSDLGGGEAQVTLHSLPLRQIEIKNNSIKDKRLIALETYKARCIKQALAEFKLVIAKGSQCGNLQEYWQLLLSCPTPIIYLPKSADAEQLLAALREYAQQQPDLSPRQLFYINDPKQLSAWWETTHIANNKADIVPGWLQQFLLGKTPRILVMDLTKFEPYDLISHQGIGDKNRILQGLSLPPSVKVICIAPLTLTREDIFSSRFISFSYRADLFAEVKPIQYLPTADEKALSLSTTHLYDDSASNYLGAPELEGDEVTFTPGPVADAITKKHDLLLTDVPRETQYVLFMAKFTEQIVLNSIPRAFPDITIYQHKRPLAQSKYIKFVDDITISQNRYHLNSHSYQLLVNGDRRIDPKSGRSYSRPALLGTDELPDLIVVTQTPSHSDWNRFIDRINECKQSVSVYVCPGVKIPSIEDTKPVKYQSIEVKDEKTLPPSHVIESNAPEATLNMLITQSVTSVENVLTLTPEVGLELLALINRKGDRYLLEYQPGWLLEQLRSGKITVLIGDMSSSLFDALESLFSTPSHLYTNEGRETFSGRVIWIKSSAQPHAFAPTVSRRWHYSELKTVEEKKAIKTDQLPFSYRQNVDRIQAFIEDKNPSANFLELVGPPGSGKTTSIKKVVSKIHQYGQPIQHFSSVADYVTWRKENPDESKTLCVLQLAYCKMSPPGYLEFLRDISRNHRFYWQGVWYPGLKIIMTNNPETNLNNSKHPLFTEQSIPSLLFAPFTLAELDEYILEPLLQEIKSIQDHTKPISDLILSAYRYVAENLAYAPISSRELTTVCQRLVVLLNIHHEEKPLQVAARACYEEFFGLFQHENQRQLFWQFLQKSALQIIDEGWTPIQVDMDLIGNLQQQGLLITPQGGEMVSMIQRLLQMRRLHGQKDCPGKCGLLLEGPPGILKTELSIAVLEAHQITACPEIPDGKPHYFNLVGGEPALIEKKLLLAYSQGWIVVCNELNLLQPSTIQLLMQLLDAPKTGFCLIGTQNHHRAGGGRKLLLPAVKSRLQVLHLRKYNRDQLISFAKSKGLTEAALLTDMFLALQNYQTLYQQPLANPRHYFRWLATLTRLPSGERTLAVIAHHLLETSCHLLLSPQEHAEPGQHHALRFILSRVPAPSFPYTDKLTLTDASKLSLIQSQPKSNQSKSREACLVM